jgi:hypothetical protein
MNTTTKHALIAMGFAALAVVAAIFVPEARWEKLGVLLERIVEDPAGAAVAVSLIAGAITTLRGAWMRQPPPPAIAFLMALSLASLTGCGGVSAEVRTAYAVEVARCVANERAIVDRQGSTREQDETDLASERTRCDTALHAIEETP